MDDRSHSTPRDAWLDFGQAGALLGLSAPHVTRLFVEGTIATTAAPSGRSGVMKSDLLAWHRQDLVERRAALAAFASAVDREVFG